MATSVIRALFIILSCFSIWSCADAEIPVANQPRYTISVCAIFQNEASYFKEWIEYHRLIGVEHFYLFNNDSTDDFLEVLQPYIAEGVVDLINWPGRDKNGSWLQVQINAYNFCIKKCRGISTWLAIIDLDEFIVPVQKANLVEFLADFDQKPTVGGIKMHFQLYGTSFLPAISADRLMIESLILKAPTDYASKTFPNNTVVKSIVRPEAIQKYEIHSGTYKPGYTIFPEGGYDRFLTPVQVDQIRLNHYWTRAEDFLCDVKLGRRARFTGEQRNQIIQKAAELNQVEDKVIFKYVPALRERMGLP